MAFLEPLAEVGAEAGAEGGAGAGAGAGGAEFNDMPGGKIVGSMFGKVVHSVMGAIGTGGGEERVDEGPIGHIG